MGITSAEKKRLKDLGAKLKAKRLERGYTLKQLGYEIDKDPQSISRVEMGDINPTYLYLLKLCGGLEMELSELFS